MSIVLRDIYAARRAIAPRVRRTPLVHSPALSGRTGANVYLKLETTHDIASFKIRAATNRILRLSEQERRRGIVAVSSGNHGRAVAYAANRLGIRAVVCMPQLVRQNKRDAIRRLGADVRLRGDSQDEAETKARRLVAEEGLTLVHPFDDADVISGRGTIAEIRLARDQRRRGIHGSWTGHGCLAQGICDRCIGRLFSLPSHEHTGFPAEK